MVFQRHLLSWFPIPSQYQSKVRNKIKYEVKLRPIKQREITFGGQWVSQQSFWLIVPLALARMWCVWWWRLKTFLLEQCWSPKHSHTILELYITLPSGKKNLNSPSLFQGKGTNSISQVKQSQFSPQWSHLLTGRLPLNYKVLHSYTKGQRHLASILFHVQLAMKHFLLEN